MSAWWWIPIGLAAWFAVAVVTALIVGPVLAGGSPRPPQDDTAERGER